MIYLPPEIVNNTLVDYPRFEKLEQFIDETSHLPGSMAEVGVYKGGTALFIRRTAIESRKLFLFDTFEGMPAVTAEDLHKEGDFSDTSLVHVDQLLMHRVNYAIYKGVFPRDNSQYVSHRLFSFVHLDVDIYTSVRNCLDFFGPRMAEGGIIVIDDYNEPDCPGAKKAADEWAVVYGGRVELTVQSQAIIRF